jgi:hypothetical protein
MIRGPKLALLGSVSVLTGLLACGPDAPGDIRTFAHYQVVVDATDQPDLNTGRPQRQLMFNFTGNNVTSPSQCASFGDATATFAGQPVVIPDPGGWVKNQIPTNTAPGQIINGDFCYEPFIEVLFNDPQGEPQNGTLAIEGAGVDLEVPFNHAFGSPSITLISTTATTIVVGLQNFLTTPTTADIEVTLTDVTGSSIATQMTGVTADGMVELSLPAGAITRPVDANLLVMVNLGDDAIQCLGFMSCSASSRFIRDLSAYIPFP